MKGAHQWINTRAERGLARMRAQIGRGHGEGGPTPHVCAAARQRREVQHGGAGAGGLGTRRDQSEPRSREDGAGGVQPPGSIARRLSAVIKTEPLQCKRHEAGALFSI